MNKDFSSPSSFSGPFVCQFVYNEANIERTRTSFARQGNFLDDNDDATRIVHRQTEVRIRETKGIKDDFTVEYFPSPYPISLLAPVPSSLVIYTVIYIIDQKFNIIKSLTDLSQQVRRVSASGLTKHLHSVRMFPSSLKRSRKRKCVADVEWV